MKKSIRFTFIFFALFLISCQEDLDDVIQSSSNLQINDFVWKAMNVFYFYKSDQPDLANDRFSSDQEYTDYLNTFQTPEDLFEDLLVDEDRFSRIFSDYRIVESSSQGVSLSSGMRFGLVRIGETNQVFGYVRYIVPNSPAESAEVERGMVFRQVNGIDLTDTNFGELIFQPTQYTIGLAELQGNTIVTTGETITLTKTQITENPIHIAKTLDINGQKIGYLMYNAFRSNFESELNQAFGDFLADGVTELVLDLRYNGGGRVDTAKDLASMITGQFNGELFATETFNENFEGETLLFDDFTAGSQNINNLNLSRVYILTSGSTASASELIINSLDPYIEVIQIGTNTVGKFQGSALLYDSPNFLGQNINPGHFYAIQPLIFEIANAVGFTGTDDGFDPEVELAEDFFDLGILGEPSEPLLNRALIEIGVGLQGNNSNEIERRSPTNFYKVISESGAKQPDYQRMYSNLNRFNENNQ